LAFRSLRLSAYTQISDPVLSTRNLAVVALAGVTGLKLQLEKT
jgi:hypothetical protein